MATLTVILILMILLRRRSRDNEMTETIVETAEDKTSAAVDAELGEVQDRMKEALSFLRKSKLGSRFSSKHLYQLPWYIIIGPPGAGKTTAIINSGLKFPLAEKMGKGAVGGVGGTRNCDWWFTNDSVLLDTAGRYTTQDSDQSADSQAWAGFLDMLKKHRKRQPINGAMIAISLSDLSMQDETTRAGHARAIRTRLHELREKLGVRFPVYILFTKADLIAGFSEFFDNLGSDERAQVWGFTLPFSKAKTDESPMAAFRTEFDTLLGQLSNRSLERMQSETDYQRRSLISGFPSQIASLRGVAEQFLGDVFQDSRYEDRQLLRGLYFTSGTQEGTPIDRLMMGMARTFGIGRQAIGSGQGTGRSFFLTRLLEGVIFPEAGMVSADDAVERRFKWITRGAIAVALVVVSAFSALWTMSFLGNSDLIATARENVAEYQTITSRIPGNPIADSDLPAVVPALNILRDLPGNPAQGDPEPPTQLTWGLYQGDAVGSEAAQSYRGALNQLMLPRLLLRLEEQMQANMNDTDLLYEGLKIYMMLGLQGPMDEGLIKQWLSIDWSFAYAGNEELQADLVGHLDQMLSQPMQQIALNGPLVEQIQGLLSETPQAERIYNGIVQSPTARAIPQFRITDVGGPAAGRVLVRSSGKPLSDGIEGIYTYDGFRSFFLEQANEVSSRLQKEAWVLGPRSAASTTEANLERIQIDVLNLYYNDYVSRYDALLGDIDIVPMESLSHAVDVTNILSGSTSPVVAVLKAVSEETKLATARQPEATAEGVTEGAAEFALDDLRDTLDSRQQLLLQKINAAQISVGQEPETPGQYVEDRFEWLHNLVDGAEGQPSQLDDVVRTMTEVYQELNRLSLGQGGTGLGNPAGSGNAAAKLQAETGRLPGPMQRWANQVASGSSGITAGGARTNLNALWQAKVYP
ncbi:MAG: type VI secretion system membrane subunit TssM, partial [Pseudomonadota bacterium]